MPLKIIKTRFNVIFKLKQENNKQDFFQILQMYIIITKILTITNIKYKQIAFHKSA